MKNQFVRVCFSLAVSLALSVSAVYAEEADVSSDISQNVSADLSAAASEQNVVADLSADGAVRVTKINLSGVKLSRARFDKQLPVHVGDEWNDELLTKVMKFLNTLQNDNVIESGNYGVTPVISGSSAELTIYVAEKLPLFAFAFPFYSTTKGFKAKLKYWQFYYKGMPMPIEAQLQYIAKDWLGFSINADKIRINDNMNFTFNLDAFTSTLNFLSTDYNWHSDIWESGIDDLSAFMNITIPKTQTYIRPYIGMGYGNVITTAEEYSIEKIVSQNHVTLLNPTIQIKQPIDNKGSYFRTNLGFGYKNYYTSIGDASGDTVSIKNEFSLALIGNNPNDIKNPLENPVQLGELGIALPKINSMMYLNLDTAVMQTIMNISSSDGADVLYTYDDIFLKEFSYSKFEDDILKKIDNLEDREFVKSCYYKDTDDKKYYLNKGTDNATKDKIWRILQESGIVYNNGFMIGPSIRFDFAVGKTGLHILPSVSFGWNMKYEDIKVRNQTVSVTSGLGAYYNIPFVGLMLKFNSSVTYAHEWWDDDIMNEYHTDIVDKVTINEIMLSAEKFIPLSSFYLNRQMVNNDLRPKAGHQILARFRLEADPAWRYANGITTSHIETTMEVMYSLYLPVYKSHKFKFRGLLYASFNDVTDKALNNDLIGDWVRGKGYDSLDSYFGIIFNFDYWIPLFVVDTNKFVGKTMKKPMMWDVYWVWYTDVMLGATNQETELTLDKNLMHLLPAFTVGTAFRFYPKFIPLGINVEVSLNTYNLLKEKGSFTSYLYFEFSITHQISSNWFHK